MEIIPAIDIRGGKCVRLYQGDYSREIVFSEDPVDTALRWQSLGAPRLHLVDLDGAQTGEIVNLATIKEIVGSVLVPTELGGGIRRLETVEQALKIGVERVVIGTAAVENPDLVTEACRRFGESVAVSIDARDGKLATHGWLKQTEIAATDFVRSMVRIGVKRFIYTDINRDGTLTEPNFSAIFELLESTRLPIIASGGISRLIHIKILKRLGVSAAIIGKALYTGDINLKQALAALDQ
ncbi:MAG: 1-(5-phosphoribosyl)-5-[(5-phosphoribosylamino)methylideneamino]imidazole-4-carboxamide isomerase [Chloroflexota bacterium]